MFLVRHVFLVANLHRQILDRLRHNAAAVCVLLAIIDVHLHIVAGIEFGVNIVNAVAFIVTVATIGAAAVDGLHLAAVDADDDLGIVDTVGRFLARNGYINNIVVGTGGEVAVDAEETRGVVGFEVDVVFAAGNN